MAAYIPVPRDLTRVKTKVFFNLTKRQLLCFGAAALIGVPIFFLVKATGNVSLAALSMMIVMLPLFFLAKLNGGDMKSVQGDSGHAQVKMVADVYSHIIDDDRRLNAERMEAAFYSGRQATPEPVQPAATESSADDKELLLKLLQNPEMAALLKSLAKTL